MRILLNVWPYTGAPSISHGLHSQKKLTLNSCQLPIPSQIVVRLFLPHLSMLGFCLIWVCTSVMYAVITTVNSYVQLPYYVWKILFPSSHLLPLALTFFFLCSHSTVILHISFGWTGYNIYVLFRSRYSAVSYSISWQVVGVCDNCHLLNIEVSSMSVQIYINLWI